MNGRINGRMDEGITAPFPSKNWRFLECEFLLNEVAFLGSFLGGILNYLGTYKFP